MEIGKCGQSSSDEKINEIKHLTLLIPPVHKLMEKCLKNNDLRRFMNVLIEDRLANTYGKASMSSGASTPPHV